MTDYYKTLQNKLNHHYETALKKYENLDDLSKEAAARAYAEGFKKALEIVDTHTEEFNSIREVPENVRDAGSAESAAPRLFELSADQVAGLNLDKLDAGARGFYSVDELTEAAFRFENDLMAILGDDNTIPIDAYENLEKEKLIDILCAAVDKIQQIQGR